MGQVQVQYISDENNKVTGVIVPIDLWHELQTEKETAHLFHSGNRVFSSNKIDDLVEIEQGLGEPLQLHGVGFRVFLIKARFLLAH